MSSKETARPTTTTESLATTKKPRKRSNSVGASPVLRTSARKRGRPSHSTSEQPITEATPEVEPTLKKMATGNTRQNNGGQDILAIVTSLKQAVDKLTEQMPTKTEMQKMEDNIKADVGRNTENIQKLFKLRKDDREQFREKVLEVVAGTSTAAGGDGSNNRRMDEYMQASRSLRIWPVAQEAGRLEENCKDFFARILEMPGDVADGMTIQSTRRLVQTRRSKITDEVLICFATSRERDIVQSYAVNLSKHKDKAGIKLKIPAHLISSFRLLEQHAGALRAQFPAGLKRAIKFDDATMDLAMDVKIPTNVNGHRLTVDQVRKANRSRPHVQRPQNSSSNTAEEEAERNAALLVAEGPPIVEEEECFEDATQQ